MLQFYNGRIVDKYKRQICLKGVNLDGMSKMPAKPEITTFHSGPEFWDGDNVSFVGRPFALDTADDQFALIKSWGFNTIRYVFTWESIEHAGPGKYDDDFCEYVVKTLRIAEKYGFLVFMDPHQDVWGRFSGGSGAPMWTYYACGMDPQKFNVTRAAVVQNTMKDPETMPKMLWPTNYYRMACLTIFTLFFGGNKFAPKCIINGVNIEDYLKEHFMNACLHLYKIIEDAGLFETCVFGIETMNEPNMGLIGFGDISRIPKNQNLRLQSTPTAFQSFLLASGKPQKVENYLFGSLGPKLDGHILIDPKGTKVWLQDDKMDVHYGWKRDPEWELGRCIWAQHNVWDDKTDMLLDSNYFCRGNLGNMVHESYTVDNFFLPYWQAHFELLRKELKKKEIFLLCQPPALFVPPLLKGTKYIDDYVIYAPHFYDGLTLMLKRWCTLWNVDSLGYLRGNYKIPLFALKVGEAAIRKCLSGQLGIIRQEGVDKLGPDVPCLMSETGIPMDMNNRESFVSDNYTPQIKALDALSAALEHNMMNYTWWCYSSGNNNKQGDLWNYEDFSFCSLNRARAEEAYVRPGFIAVKGHVLSSHFHLSSGDYHLVINGEACTDEVQTIVFVPKIHYSAGNFIIKTSEGTWELEDEIVSWNHPEGTQLSLKISKRNDGCSIA